MTKPKNAGKPWSPADEKQFDKFVKEDTPTRLIAYKLGRSEDAIYSHASEKGKSLKPTNQSPYNRHKKR